MSKMDFIIAFMINTVLVIHEVAENVSEMMFGSSICQLSTKVSKG